MDCPWYPEKHGAAHCTSSANFAGIYNLHKTAEKCCEEHFGGGSVISCVQKSVADVKAEEDLVQKKLSRPRYYWPDLYGKKNCVFDSGYDDWMEGAVSSLNSSETVTRCKGHTFSPLTLNYNFFLNMRS